VGRGGNDGRLRHRERDDHANNVRIVNPWPESTAGIFAQSVVARPSGIHEGSDFATRFDD